MKRLTPAALGAMSRCPKRLAQRSAARGRPRTRARERGGPEKCRASTIYAHDRVPGKPPDDRRDSNTWPGCGPTWRASHNSRADRKGESAKKFLLRDHAPPQLRLRWGVVAKMWFAGGALAGPGHAVLWPRRLGDAWPAAWQPASAAPDAGTRDPDNNAGSNAAACSGAHSLCADKPADVVADSGSRLA
jgi:hypothetical protein